MPVAEQVVQAESWAPADTGRAGLRGVAQVALSSNAWSGLLFTVALFVDGWQLGLYGLLGAASSTVAAALLGADRKGLTEGLQGYCGCLTGIALMVRLGGSWQAAVLTVLAAAVCSVLSAAAGRFLGPRGLPVLTAPYCLVAGALVVALSKAPVTAGATTRISGFTNLTVTETGRALCNNIGQVFYLDKWYASLLVLVGLFVASRISRPRGDRRERPDTPDLLCGGAVGRPDRRGAVRLQRRALRCRAGSHLPDSHPVDRRVRGARRRGLGPLHRRLGGLCPAVRWIPLHLAVHRDDLALPGGRSSSGPARHLVRESNVTP